MTYKHELLDGIRSARQVRQNKGILAQELGWNVALIAKFIQCLCKKTDLSNTRPQFKINPKSKYTQNMSTGNHNPMVQIKQKGKYLVVNTTPLDRLSM